MSDPPRPRETLLAALVACAEAAILVAASCFASVVFADAPVIAAGSGGDPDMGAVMENLPLAIVWMAAPAVIVNFAAGFAAARVLRRIRSDDVVQARWLLTWGTAVPFLLVIAGGLLLPAPWTARSIIAATGLGAGVAASVVGVLMGSRKEERAAI